jgi:hypothetical protein
MPGFDLDQLRVAVHEAGHAVVAQLLDIAPERVRANAIGGLTTFLKAVTDAAPLEDVAAVLMAGEAAERHLFGDVARPSHVDQQAIMDCHLTCYATRAAMRKAEAAVRDHADRIFGLAVTLYRHGSLSGDRLAKLMSGDYAPMFAWRPFMRALAHGVFDG